MHPALRRAWLQTGGLPVEPIHADLRAEFDQVHTVNWIGGGCFKCQDHTGRQIAIIQFQGPAQARVDDAVMATTERLAAGAEKPADVKLGDTIIRELDLSDPLDRAMAENAIRDAASNVIIPDAERADPPPIDLPDYDGPRPTPAVDPGPPREFWLNVVALAIVVAVVAAVVLLWRS